MYRKSFGISAEKYAEPFAGVVTVAYFQVCEICLKFSFASLDFPMSPRSAPGSPRMGLKMSFKSIYLRD